MANVDNLGRIFNGISKTQKLSGKEWKILGQEQDGSLVIGWVVESHDACEIQEHYCVGLYLHGENKIQVLYRFKTLIHIVQATVNSGRTLLGYVSKEKVYLLADTLESDESDMSSLDYRGSGMYKAYIVETSSTGNTVPIVLTKASTQQTMIQFLYKKKEHSSIEKFLLFVHHKSILLYQVQLNIIENDEKVLDQSFSHDILVRAFMWAQWDPVHQSLYFIHHRKPQMIVEGDTEESYDTELLPILSCLQFHDDLPHETVLNIPLNLPQLPNTSSMPCGGYEDDPIPLRIHDCSLDLQVVSDPKGLVCICHHYLYQPVRPPMLEVGGIEESSNTVHFAYSVTLLHHGCVLHCVVPGVPWSQARVLKPTFIIHREQHMLVYAPGLFTHLLDVGLSHEPCCHVLMGHAPPQASHLVPLLQPGGGLTLDLRALDLVRLVVSPRMLLDTFRQDPCLSTRLAILHYFLVHAGDMESVAELLGIVAENPFDLTVPQIFQEVVIGGAYASTQKNLTSEAMPLVTLLPLTTIQVAADLEVKAQRIMTLSHEVLWNTAMMLLSPQQRLVPYSVDMWTRLWDQLARRANKERIRFQPSQVADKLMVSLVCYQGMDDVGVEADLAAIAGSRKGDLPFYEVENCTASKQEHVISVNLRELSMHLLKSCSKQTPMNVHVVATRYVAAQLEMCKQLCLILCQCASVDPHEEQERGFALIDQLDEGRRQVLFSMLERFYFAVDSLAFPLPQGFTSFFTYLGYQTLSFDMFLQYLQRHVFELQVDVMKTIMADTDDSREGVWRKLRLLQFLPRSRAKRLLNQWSHPISLMIRAREHALNVLSGVEGVQTRGYAQQRTRGPQLSSRGLAAFPSADRLSPLDTFLDLLTAKASLTDLDFGLLIEATITSTDEFLD
ncbi:Protein pigeon [Gryllus bimaculatus]|nr:Protein pigeon [Gryllus bimaculatus]